MGGPALALKEQLLDGNGCMSWDGQNKEVKPLANGMFIAILESNGKSIKNKLALY
jgi:hypothetical protein